MGIWVAAILFLLSGCAHEPVEKPIVDLSTLGRPMPPPTLVPLEDGNKERRMLVGPKTPREQSAWLEALKRTRERDRKVMELESKEKPVFDRGELRWTQTSFIEYPVLAQDRFFYDALRNVYTVDRLVDDFANRFGGADVVVLSAASANLGIDERNQFDMIRDLPGGVSVLRRAVADFHRRGLKVLLPFLAGDTGTRSEGQPGELSAVRLMRELGADGILAENSAALSVSQFPDSLGDRPFAVENDLGFGSALGTIQRVGMGWGDLAPYNPVPGVDRYRWLEPRFLTHVVQRNAVSHIDELQYAWFNGAGFVAWEDRWGFFAYLSPNEAEIVRRMAMIYRLLPEFSRSRDWEPHAATLQATVYASKWPLPFSGTVWTLINRSDVPTRGPTLELEYRGQRFYNLWTGEELTPDGGSPGHFNLEFRGKITLSVPLGSNGFGAVIEVNTAPSTGAPLALLLARMKARSASLPETLNRDWKPMPEFLVENPPTQKFISAPEGMVKIPGSLFRFVSTGKPSNEHPGSDVQYPWESTPRLQHSSEIRIPTFFIDRVPVTNLDYKRYLDERAYRPTDSHNFLRDWPGGKYSPAAARRPVTWISLEEARAYCRALGKRLPREWEWQYAAQGNDGRVYPWGNEWDSTKVPYRDNRRVRRAPPEVGSYPGGASPFGVLDMTGLIWHWTDEFYDSRLRAAVLKGGSYFQPEGDRSYLSTFWRREKGEEKGQTKLTEHLKLLLMAPSLDRSGTIGFRCAADAEG